MWKRCKVPRQNAAATRSSGNKQNRRDGGGFKTFRLWNKNRIRSAQFAELCTNQNNTHNLREICASRHSKIMVHTSHSEDCGAPWQWRERIMRIVAPCRQLNERLKMSEISRDVLYMLDVCVYVDGRTRVCDAKSARRIYHQRNGAGGAQDGRTQRPRTYMHSIRTNIDRQPAWKERTEHKQFAAIKCSRSAALHKNAVVGHRARC